VAHLAELAATSQWEILFPTKGHTGMDTAQADAQRWLESKIAWIERSQGVTLLWR
jgi:hypothetical protein